MGAVSDSNQAKPVKGRRSEPRTMYSVRLPVPVSVKVKAQAEKWGVSPTEAVSRLIGIGLVAEAGAYDPNEQFDALGLNLAAIADRLDRLDKVGEAAARAAIKGALITSRQLREQTQKESGEDTAKRLDIKLNEAVEKTMQEHGIF